jgi:hypothetical protein
VQEADKYVKPLAPKSIDEEDELLMSGVDSGKRAATKKPVERMLEYEFDICIFLC